MPPKTSRYVVVSIELCSRARLLNLPVVGPQLLIKLKTTVNAGRKPGGPQRTLEVADAFRKDSLGYNVRLPHFLNFLKSQDFRQKLARAVDSSEDHLRDLRKRSFVVPDEHAPRPRDAAFLAKVAAAGPVAFCGFNATPPSPQEGFFSVVDDGERGRVRATPVRVGPAGVVGEALPSPV